MAAPATPHEKDVPPLTGAPAALASVFAASPLAQALFDADGQCVAASAAFTRRAAASADDSGRLSSTFLEAAEVHEVELEGHAYRLVSLSAREEATPAAGPRGFNKPRAMPGGLSLETLMRTVLDALPAAISATDAQGRYVYVNALQARLWQTDPKSAIGRTPAEMQREPSPENAEQDRRVLETGEAVPLFTEAGTGANGAACDWLVTKLPLVRPGQPKAGGVITFAFDASEVKPPDAAALKSRQAADAANEAKTLVLAQVTQELRTPLNAIIGFTEMMTQEFFGPLGAPQYAGYAGDILRAAQHLLGIITDMLDVMRLEAGELALDLAPTVPGDVVIEAGRSMALLAANKRVMLRQYAELGLPPLKADARRLRQALVNLISNAVKFTPEGGTVSFGVRRAGESIELYVEDSGIGMSSAEIPVALLVFGRVGDGYAKAQAGAGIGLPLAKALIERHGGSLHIESVPERGTKVRAVFPPACFARDERGAV